MALAVRVIPTVLYDGDLCVKPVAFARPARPVGSVLAALHVHERREVDEIVLLDVSGGVPADVGPFADALFTPFSVGGGIRSVDDVDRLLRQGADKVVFGPSACWSPGLLESVASRWGSQAVCVHVVATNAVTASVTAASLVERGAGEVLVTSRARDGAQTGYDLDLIESVARSVSVPVVAAGGCRSADDAVAAVRAGAAAVAVGAAFHFTSLRPRDIKQALRSAGFSVRLSEAA